MIHDLIFLPVTILLREWTKSGVVKPTSHIVHNFGEGGQVSRPTTIDKVPGEWCLSDDQLLALSCNCSQTLYLAFISFSMVFVEVRASFPLHIKPSSCKHCSCPQLQLHFSFAVRGVISTQYFYRQCSEGVSVSL